MARDDTARELDPGSSPFDRRSYSEPAIATAATVAAGTAITAGASPSDEVTDSRLDTSGFVGVQNGS